MPVYSTHPDYDAHIEKWIKCRDVIAGEEVVKAAGTKYLPALNLDTLDDLESSNYDAYKARAMFFGAADRTVKALAGTVMARQPRIEVPEAMEEMLEDLSRNSESLDQLLNQALEQVLAVGRVGYLVDSSDDQPDADPYVVTYFAENIVNWRDEEIDGRRQPTLVVLEEEVAEGGDDYLPDLVKQYRVLRLVREGEVKFYQVETYRENKTKDAHERWVLHSTKVPTVRGGRRLEYIPFIIINPSLVGTPIQKPPLLDLVNVNLSHYRTSADLEHGRHFTALPTAFVSGFDPKTTKFAIGSARAWVSQDPNASAGFLEFTGAGLGSLQDALNQKEGLMAVLGARLLEESKRAAETAEAIRLRQAGEGSVLRKTASSVEEGFTFLLYWIAEWLVLQGDISLELNKDYGVGSMDSATLASLMVAVQSGLLSKDTWLYNMKRSDFIPDDVTIEDERAKIDITAPQLPALPAEVIDVEEETT